MVQFLDCLCVCCLFFSMVLYRADCFNAVQILVGLVQRAYYFLVGLCVGHISINVAEHVQVLVLCIDRIRQWLQIGDPAFESGF